MRVALGAQERPRYLQRLLDKAPFFALIAYCAGLYWGYVILNPEVSEPTRISEHALMVGIVNEKFNKEGVFTETFQMLKKNHKQKRSILSQQLLNHGMEVYDQKWSVVTGIKNASGINLYAYIQARRTASVESILIIVDIEDDEMSALAVALASYFRVQSYWARDIFFLFSDGGILAIDAFLRVFKGAPSVISVADSIAHSGSQMLALLSLRSNRHSDTIEIQLNQLNGFLPNLDYVNTLVRLSGLARFQMPAVLYGINPMRNNPWWWFPFRALFTQAFVSIEGPHSVATKYGTHGVSVAMPVNSQDTIQKAARFIEAVTRSLNNMLERFHQSYFFYILSDEDNFVSIAYYMPILAGVLAPLLIFGYYEWAINMKVFDFPSALPLAHIISGAMWAASRLYCERFPIPEHFELLSLICVVPFGFFLSVPSSSLPSLRFFVLLESALLFGVLSLLNFGLALLTAIPAVPLIVLATRDRSAKPLLNQIIRNTVIFALHPLSLIVLWGVYVSPYLGHRPLDPSKLSIHDYVAPLIKMLRAHILVECHMYALFFIAAVPLWNILLRTSAPIFTSNSS